MKSNGWILLIIYIFLSLAGAMVAYLTPRLEWYSAVVGYVITMFIVFFAAGATVMMKEEK